MFQHYCPHGMGHLAYGISGKFDDERRAEDLVSIVDLVAGALSEDLSSAITEEYSTSSKISVPVLRRISLKSQLIIFWLWNLCGPRTPLKKMICLIRPTKNGKLVFSFLNRTTMPGIMEPLWLPLNKDWEQSIKSWQLYATTHR